MRLIDADELMEHIGRDRLDSREAIMEMIKNAPTVINTRELRLKELECGQYSLECERLKAKAELKLKEIECERLKAQIRALVFALRCNGVSGNEVTYEDY